MTGSSSRPRIVSRGSGVRIMEKWASMKNKLTYFRENRVDAGQAIERQRGKPSGNERQYLTGKRNQNDIKEYGDRAQPGSDADFPGPAVFEADGAERDVGDQREYFRGKPAVHERILLYPHRQQNRRAQQNRVDDMRRDLHPFFPEPGRLAHHPHTTQQIAGN